MRAVPRVASAWPSDEAVGPGGFDIIGPAAVPPPLAPSDPVAGRMATGHPQPIAQAADFERVLRTRSRGQTQHFAVHHLPDRPSLSARARRGAERAVVVRKLSTAGAPGSDMPVDDSSVTAPAAASNRVVAAPDRLWLGAVVPKRHARRAVTRTLLKRQIRGALERHAAALAPGLWVVRLRAPFDKAQFPSAASDQLKRVARAELDALFDAATAR